MGEPDTFQRVRLVLKVPVLDKRSEVDREKLASLTRAGLTVVKQFADEGGVKIDGVLAKNVDLQNWVAEHKLEGLVKTIEPDTRDWTKGHLFATLGAGYTGNFKG